MKIGQTDPQIICLKCFFEKNEGVQALAPLKLRSYWTEVHQLLHHVARSTQMNMLKSELRYSTLFRNAKVTNKGK